MNGPALLRCPGCGAPTSFGAAFCSYCRGPLTWGAAPALSRGALIARVDAAREPLVDRVPAGALSVQRTGDGAVVTVEGRKAVGAPVGPRRRHGCIVVDAVALDPTSVVGISAREQEKSISGGYSLAVVPQFRSVNLACVVASTDRAYARPLHAYEFQRCIRPVGQPNEVELRCADSIVQVFVNGEHVAACVDATFGFGAFGWRLQALTAAPARVLMRSVALYDVA